MMINKRLIDTVAESKRYVAGSVACQWLALVANIGMVFAFCRLLERLWLGSAAAADVALSLAAFACAVAVRSACTVAQAALGFRASSAVKRTLRHRVYEKLLRLGASYRQQVMTSEVVQVAVEGIDQLETYFASYLPQFFYALLAPLTLFAVLCTIDVPSAVVLLVCVPLIPAAIVAVQRWAKRLLARYWGQYTELGDTFLENLQGLTTLKIYQADEFKQQEMNEQAEAFRRITMRVLIMQLNSITVMDLVAYGGAAAGIAVALVRLGDGAVGLGGALAIILLAADYFIPMRRLGSFFHIAMNGMAASDKMFRLLDMDEPRQGAEPYPDASDIAVRGLGFSYVEGRQALCGIDLAVPAGAFTAIVGESGCGKSTLAAVLMGRNRGYTGLLRVGGVELAEISDAALLAHVTYVGHQSYLFGGTVRDNLLMAAPQATDDELWEALERTRLAAFLRGEQGLDTMLTERAANLSGGQRQRLAIARALLHDTPVYVFDEATSNIDAESEDAIMGAVRSLAGTKTVLLISHRLANVVDADRIVVMDAGRIVEAGTHAELLGVQGRYARLWRAQRELEGFGDEGAGDAPADVPDGELGGMPNPAPADAPADVLDDDAADGPRGEAGERA